MGNPFQRHKFRAKPDTRGDIRFDSKLEARYYDRLCLRVKRREVLFFLRQVTFHLPGRTRYVCDFQEFHYDGTVHFVDVKGMETETFKLKKRQVEDLYPVTIELVKAKDLRHEETADLGSAGSGVSDSAGDTDAPRSRRARKARTPRPS